MREILDLQLQIVSAAKELNHMPTMGLTSQFTPGIRDFFEAQGRNVGWHRDTNEFSIDGRRFDATGFQNIDGRLQATYQQLLELERELANIPRFDKGGRIPEDTLAVVHKDEHVLRPDEAKAWRAGKFSKVEINQISMENFANLLANGLRIDTGSLQSIMPFADMPLNGHHVNTVNNNNSTPINIDMDVHGVTSESLVRDLPKMAETIAWKVTNEHQRRENDKGKAGGIPRRIRP